MSRLRINGWADKALTVQRTHFRKKKSFFR